MTQEEITDETQVETQEGSDESTTAAEPTDESSSDESKLTYEEKLAAATTDAEKFAIANAEAAKNRRLLAKSQKPKATEVKPQPTKASTSPADVQETVLRMNGMPDELITKLKRIAAINGTDLATAQTDELFVAAKEKYEKEKKSQQASMGASRGSSQKKATVTASTPNLSREEHMRLAKEAMEK